MNLRTDVYTRAVAELPHVRDVELDDILDTNQPIRDILHLCAHKVSLVRGNKHATLTVIQDMIWAVLSTLWDQDLLMKKHEILKLIKSNDNPSDEIASLRFKLAMRDKELKNAFEAMQNLEMQSRHPELSCCSLESWDTVGVCEAGKLTYDVMVGKEPNQLVISSSQCVELHGLQPTTNNEGLLTQIGSLQAENQRLSGTTTESSGGSGLPATEDRPTRSEDTLRPLTRGRSMVTDPPTRPLSRARSIMTEQAGQVFPVADSGVQAGQARTDSLTEIDGSQTDNPELMRETFEDVRINQLLFEITEKDELIETLSVELGRATSRRSSTSSSKVLGCSPSEVPAILTQRLNELETLRTHLTSLSITVNELRAEKASLEARLAASGSPVEIASVIRRPVTGRRRDVLEDSGRISERSQSLFDPEYTDSPCQTDDIISLLSSRALPAIIIRSVDTESDLIAELEAERLKTEKAVEETRRAKVCLDELERQLVSLQFQLRKAGVNHDHIQHAMRRSGLSGLLRASHAGVFERLYRDALERMERFEKIRCEAHALQASRLMRRAASADVPSHSVSVHSTLPLLAVPGRRSPRGVTRHAFGGGFIAGFTAIKPSTSPAYRTPFYGTIAGIRLL